MKNNQLRAAVQIRQKKKKVKLLHHLVVDPTLIRNHVVNNVMFYDSFDKN
ncbi:hypothetical protein [Bacillus sp. FJAT-49736]|nr:hypothetical protein [Bacillus sp. FJAT-49736]MBS4171837.1 hypothetical protein [Bacillus sp. FJAT-49736]